MIWKKRGILFDPTTNDHRHAFQEFAQSPQTIVFDDFVRIYFSTRTRDNTGSYLSQIAYIDYDLDFKEILNISNQEIISLGALGTYDQHGIFPIHPFKNGNDIYAFLTGWNRRVSVPVETSIGIAKSVDNGKTFQRLGSGPILSSSYNEPHLVGDGFVIKNQTTFYMFYIFGVKWHEAVNNEPPARVYKIGMANSKDLINWSKNEGNQIIESVLNEDECQALPTVIEHNGIYHMVFCYREATDFRTNPQRGYRLGYAFSKDLISWKRDDNELGLCLELNSNEWDSKMMCYPHLFKVKNKVYLLYNGNEFGKFGFGLAELVK
jgi:hypothetical protein